MYNQNPSNEFKKINLIKCSHFRDYEKIIIVFRDPILRAMSPSNKLINGLPFTLQKMKDRYFIHDFARDLKIIMPAWKAWFEKILQINAKFCLISYDEMKINSMEKLRPVVKFLGFEINNELEQCIMKNGEGNYHRPEKSMEEIDKILSLIPPGELDLYFRMKKDVFKELQSASSC